MGSRGKRHGGRGGADAPADCAYPWCLFGYFLGMPIYNASATVNKKSDSKRKSQ